jgi:hypothetical protein
MRPDIAAADRDGTRADQIQLLRELIEALDRRIPTSRSGEIQIARDAASLREKALKRIALLEPVQPSQMEQP